MRGTQRGTLVAGIAAAVLILGASTAWSAPAQLDPGFGAGGIVLDQPDGENRDDAFGAAIQSDGKLVLAGTVEGSAGRQALVARLLSSGQLDTGFGDGGTVRVDFDGFADELSSVAVQPDGRIVVAGMRITTSNTDMAVARLLADGALDPSFAGDGTTTIDFGTTGDTAHSVALEPDGDIVVAGHAAQDLAVARLDPAGAPDAAFSGDGRVTMPIAFGALARSVLVAPSGAIVAAGTDVNGFVAARFLPDGAPDPSFGGGDGLVTTSLQAGGDMIGAAADLRPGGGLVLVGARAADSTSIFTSTLHVAAYTEAGDLDPGFAGGLTSVNVAGGEGALTVRSLSDGSVLAGGGTASAFFGQHHYLLLKLTPTGALDNSFGRRGTRITPSEGRNVAKAMALQADGRILLAGGGSHEFNQLGPGHDAEVIRYTATGVVDPSYGSAGHAVVGTTGPQDVRVFDAARRADGATVVAGFMDSELSIQPMLVRYLADGSRDMSFGQGGVVASQAHGFAWVSVDLGAGGETVAGGQGPTSSFAVAKFAPDGTMVGLVEEDFDSEFASLASLDVLADGRVIAVGQACLAFDDDHCTSRRVAVARYLPDLTSDSSFDGDGLLLLDPTGTADAFPTSVAASNDGAALLAVQTTTDAMVVRLASGGTVDWLTPVPGFFHSENAIAVDAGGRILALTGATEALVSRLLPDGSPDAGFAGGSGTAVVDLGAEESLVAVAALADGSAVLGGRRVSLPASGAVAVKLTPTGALDPVFDGDGWKQVNFPPFVDVVQVLPQTDGKVALAGHSSEQIMLLRLAPRPSLPPPA